MDPFFRFSQGLLLLLGIALVLAVWLLQESEPAYEIEGALPTAAHPPENPTELPSHAGGKVPNGGDTGEPAEPVLSPGSSWAIDVVVSGRVSHSKSQMPVPLVDVIFSSDGAAIDTRHPLSS